MARNIRCYLPGIFEAEDRVTLPDNSAHHLCRVLRLRPGDRIELFNGQGLSYEATLTETSAKKAVAVILQALEPKLSPSCQIHLGMSLIKPDRMDWSIQKAVELGVSSITPLQTEYTSIKFNTVQCALKHRHFEKIMINAAEQCGQNILPHLSSPLSLVQWLNEQKDRPCLFLDTETSESTPLSGLNRHAHISFLVGPEGGFSPEERAACYAQGLLPWSLGPRILRSETAALAGLTLLQYAWGDWSGLTHEKYF